MSLFLEILGNMCIAVVCSLVVTSIKKSRQKHKYLRNKKRFWDEITNIYYFFKGLSVAKKSLRPESAPLSPFYRYYFGRYSSQLAQLVSLSHSRGRSTSYFNNLHDFSVSIPRCYMDSFVSSFFPHTATLWKSLPAKYTFLTYDQNSLKSVTLQLHIKVWRTYNSLSILEKGKTLVKDSTWYYLLLCNHNLFFDDLCHYGSWIQEVFIRNRKNLIN